MAPNIVVVGSINIDLVSQASKIPAPGETVIGGDLHTIPGGKGANQAVAAARLGARVAMVGRVGDDVFGPQLRANLVAAGVDPAHITETAETASGVALIVVDGQGENSIVVASGANARLTPADVETAAPLIESAEVLLLQLEVPLETVLRAAQVAYAAGVRIILNPAPARPLPAELLALVDILIPNESETATLTGLPVGSHAELSAAAAALRQFGIEVIILTLGERGALLVDQDGQRHFPAFPVARVVDTTAAGDAFAGGLATAIAEGKTVRAALPWANAAGALTVTRAGAQPSLPTRAEVANLLAEAAPEQLQGARL